MGSNEHTVQAAGPRTMGAAVMPELTRADLRAGERTVPTVKVIWTTTRQFEAEIPATLWARLDGAQGPTTNPLDDHLDDMEQLVEVRAGSDVIERNVDDAEDVR